MLNSVKGMMLTLASTFRVSIIPFTEFSIDQLMAFAWKVMVPLAFYTIIITAIYLFYNWPAWTLTLMSLAGMAVVGYLIYRRIMAPVKLVAEIKARQARQLAQRQRAQQSR